MNRKAMLVTPRFWGRDFDIEESLVFILIPFKEPFTRIFVDHIKKVVEEFNLICRKADDIFSPHQIIEDIWEQINKARFIIADVTGKNSNVFYEIGIAHTLGKDVFIITQSEQDVPFDLQDLRYILYEYTPPGMINFENKLRHFIEEQLKGVRIIDQDVLEIQTMLKKHFVRWKRFALLPSSEIFKEITLYSDYFAEGLEKKELAFILRTALWYGHDLIYWAERNYENEEAIPVLMETLKRPERRPFFRVGLVLEHLSQSMQKMVIQQAKEQLSDNELLKLVIENAEKGKTLKFWENKLSTIIGQEKTKELILRAQTSKRMKKYKSD